MLTGNVIISDFLNVLTVNSVSAHGGLHADTLSCSLGSFFFVVFQFMHKTLLKRRVTEL